MDKVFPEGGVIDPTKQELKDKLDDLHSRIQDSLESENSVWIGFSKNAKKTIQTRMYMAEYDRVLQQALGGGTIVSSLHCKTGRDRTSFTVALDKAVKAVSDKRSYDVRVMQYMF